MDFTNSYDIAPGEEQRMMIEAVVGFSREPGSESEPITRQLYLNRSPNTRFFEPIDRTDRSSNVDATPWIASNKRADHQKYQSERERLKTFDGVWKEEYNVSKEDLAREGFIYRGPGDLVLCVFCLKSIRKWDVGDTVAGEHQRLYPRCPWVCGKVDHLNIPMSKTDAMKRDMRVTGKGQPHFSDMTTRAARMESFQGWIKRDNVSVEAMVKEGFFYDHSSDIVVCFHCGIKVPGWDLRRDLSGRHAQTSPDCPMIKHDQSEQNVPPMDVQLTGHPGDENGAVHSDKQDEVIDIDDDDMQSPAVQAIMCSYGEEYSVEDIMNAVQSLKISKGSSHISSMDILQKLDPDLVS